MTYAAHSGVSSSGPAGTHNAAQTVGGKSGLGRIPAGPIIDQFGPVYLDRMQGGTAAPRVRDDVSPPKLAGPVRSDAARVGAFSEWWE